MKMEWKRWVIYTITACCMAILMIGCGQKSAGLEGTYGTDQGEGKVIPYVQISKTKDGDGYLVKMLKSDELEIRSKPLAKEQIEKAFHLSISGSYEGIQVNEVAFIKLDPGVALGGAKSESGYYAIVFLPIALTRITQ